MIFQPPQENTFPKRACRSRHSLWSRFISVFGQAAWSLPFLLVGATFRNVSVMGDTGHSFEPIGSRHLEFNLVKRFGLFINGVIFFFGWRRWKQKRREDAGRNQEHPWWPPTLTEGWQSGREMDSASQGRQPWGWGRASGSPSPVSEPRGRGVTPSLRRTHVQ